MMVSKESEITALLCITEKINSGMSLDEILNHAFDILHVVIPYDRIGFALLEDENAVLRAVWERSNAFPIRLAKNYSAPMSGSSLEPLLQSKKPRILNDLEQYLAEHPNSESTRLIVEEGMRSSLTCPLVATGKPIGFIFFSSAKKNRYQDIHTEIFLQIAGNLSLIAEKTMMADRLRELNDLKNKFLGMAAHDLRNPITVIKGYSDLIREGMLGVLAPVQKQPMDAISNNCDKMLALIREFLDISVIESGMLTLKPREVEVKPFLEKNIEMNRLLAQRKSMTIELKISPIATTVEIDPDLIEQVLNNLITNAIKYSEIGAVIMVIAWTSQGGLEISVADQGQGIPADKLSGLFQYFSKVGSQPTGKESSTGLGLAICKKIIEAHHGRIWAESKTGKGSTFCFSIPLKKT